MADMLISQGYFDLAFVIVAIAGIAIIKFKKLAGIPSVIILLALVNLPTGFAIITIIWALVAQCFFFFTDKPDNTFGSTTNNERS